MTNIVKTKKRIPYGLKQGYKSLAVAYIAQEKGYEWCPHIFGGTEHFERDGNIFYGSDIVTPKEVTIFHKLIDEDCNKDEALKIVLGQKGN